MLLHESTLSMQAPRVQPSQPTPTGLRQFAYNVLTGAFLKKRMPIRAHEPRPPKLIFTDDEAEVDFYARTAFSAFEYALERDQPHPKLWASVQGTPFEKPYLQRFGNQQ